MTPETQAQLETIIQEVYDRGRMAGIKEVIEWLEGDPAKVSFKATSEAPIMGIITRAVRHKFLK